MTQGDAVRALLDLSADAFVVIDGGWCVTEFAGRAEQLYGCTRVAALGQPFAELARAVFSPDVVDMWLRQLHEGRAGLTHVSIDRSDGAWVHVDMSLTPRDEGRDAPVSWLAVARDVTTHQLAERLLTRQREMDRVFHLIEDGIVVLAADARVLACNGAAERLLGLTAAQLEGRMPPDPRWACIHENGMPYPPESHPHMLALRTGVAVRDAVMGVARPDGSSAWLRIDAIPLTSVEAPGPCAVAATMSDITMLKRAERRERASRERLQLVLDGSTEGFWDWDIPSGRCFLSERWYRIFGLEPDTRVAQVSDWEQRLHPEDAPGVRAALDAHLRGETPVYESEHRARHEDGRWVWMLARGTVVERDRRGAAVRAAGTYTDITSRKVAEHLRHESEARLQAVVDGSPDAIAMVDLRTGTFALVNPAFCRALDVEADRVLGSPASGLLDLVHPDDRELLRQCTARVRAGDLSGTTCEHRVLVRGEYRWFAAAHTLIRDRAGVPVSLLAARRDVTERRRAEDAIRQALEESQAQVGRLEHRTLAEFLPICMYCKNIRDQDGHWDTLEHYVSAHAGSQFTHGLCEACLARFLQDHGMTEE